MYHLRFKGTHYEIGYRWGAKLKIRGVKLLDNVPFPINEEWLSFGKSCLPSYEEHFPEILDEIYGIADGQGIARKSLLAVLFSMYCIIPSTNCSCFAAKSKNGVILGRNSDFLTSIEKLYMNTQYKFTDSTYSFNANTTAFVEMEDGINECGLAIGLTSVAPMEISPGINAGMMLRLFLEKCRNVEDVHKLIQKIPIASSQTIIASDVNGNAALFECSPMAIEAQSINEDRACVYATNMFHLPNMKKYNKLPKDTWFAVERYQTMQDFFLKNRGDINVQHGKNLLSGQEGFICQYDRKTGKDTVWSVIYDLGNNLYFRCEGNPSRKQFREVTKASLGVANAKQ